ncbi:MAG TPA: translocation/assembly module TamB domain-containing protein [Terriglobia bacterium]|nr:translocation/assembly module TamB domain-containing protein [Terriglobia bacterium]
MSKPFRILAAVAVAFLIAYLAIVVTLSTQWFHDAIKRRIVSQLASATGARVEMRSLRIQPLIFQVTIQGLTLHGSELPSEPALLTAKTLLIRLSPESLFRWKLMISRFDGDGIEAHVFTYADGATNIPGPSMSIEAAASKLIDLSISTLDLQHSELAWNNRKIRLDVTAHNTGILLYHGITGRYYGSFSSDPIRLDQQGRALPPIEIATHIDLTRGGITLSHLVWQAAGLTGQTLASLKWNAGLSGRASFDVTGELSLAAKALDMKPLPSGSLGARGVATYEDGKLSAQGTVQAKKVLIHDPRFNPGAVDLTSDFAANPSQIKFTHLRVRALDGSFSGDGTVKLSATPQFALQGRVNSVNSARALNAVSQGAMLEKLLSLAPSKVSGSMEASWVGSLKRFQSRFDFTATPPASIPPDERPLAGAMQGSASLEPGFVLRIDKAQFATLHSNFSAQGQVGGPDGRLNVRYATTDFQEEQPLVDTVIGVSKPLQLALHSQAVFQGAVTGSITNPEIEGQLSVGNFTLQGWDWQSLQGAIRASSRGVAVENAQVRSGPSSFDFSGSAILTDWKVTPQSQVSFSARATHSPLEGLEEAFGFHYPITGVASGTLQVHGVSSSLGGQGDFEVSNGAIDRESFDKFSGHILIAGSSWDFQNVVFRKKRGTFAGWARLNLPARSFSMQFHGENFLLTDFARLRALAPASAATTPAPLAGTAQPAQAVKTPALQGAVEISLQGSGSFSNPQIQSELDIQDFRVGGNKAGDLKLQLSFAANQIKGDASLKGPDGSLKLATTTEMRGDWPSQFSGSFADFRLDPWLNVTGRSIVGTPVTASGTIKGEGPLKSPREITLQAQASKLAILIPGLEVQNVQPVEVRYANGRFDSNHFEMHGPSTQLSVLFSAHLAAPAEILLDVAGNAQASLLQLFDPSLRAAGSFSVDLHDSGPVAQPALSGEIGVHNLSVRYGSVPLPLSGLNGSITLKGNRATIQSLREETGQTSLELSGYATLGQIPTVDLDAKFQHVRFEYPTGFTSILSGELNLTGSTENGLLSGDVTVGEMFVTEDFNLVNWLGATGVSLETPVAENLTGAPQALASKIRLDLHVITNPTVRLDSPTLSYVASIDVNVRGTLARPVATGDIHLREGQARIAGNTYKINRGDISMSSPYQTTPVLDIEATTRVERYDLTIEITGPADRAKMSYRSDPPLPSEQILSLLALGYAPQQALMSSSGTQRMGAVGAGSLLTTALSSQVSGRFQKLFGVSHISIDPNLLGPTSAGGARVTVEEQVSRDLTVTYSTNTAAAQQRDIRLRWDVSNKISLIGERDINGVYGVEIRFHRRIK